MSGLHNYDTWKTASPYDSKEARVYERSIEEASSEVGEIIRELRGLASRIDQETGCDCPELDSAIRTLLDGFGDPDPNPMIKKTTAATPFGGAAI